MKIEIELSDELVKKIITGIMENFPEASSGSVLACTGWDYANLKFCFVDGEHENRKIHIDKTHLENALQLVFSTHWPKGCTPPPMSANWDDWDNWLCQCDATDFDAFAQLACLGEVIYG
jgi:hypothetical protein